MWILWVFIILLVLFSIACFIILWQQVKTVRYREDILLEAFWQRRHRVPLLIEATGKEDCLKIIELREKASSGAYSLAEQIGIEKELTHLIADLFQKAESNILFKTDVLWLALQKEFSGCLQDVAVALNNYNFELQKFLNYLKLPWFKIFQFLFEIRQNKPLEPI